MEKEILMPEELMTEEISEMALEPSESDDGETDQAPDEENGGQNEVAEAADKMVPLAALQKERERVRNLKRDHEGSRRIIEKLFQTTGLSSLRDLENHMETATLHSYVKERGVDPGVAKIIMEQQEGLSELKKLKRRQNSDLEVKSLRENPFYSDIEEVYETVADYADDRGLSVKEAYNALYGDKMIDKIKAMAREEALNEARSKSGKKIPALSSGGNAAEDEREMNLSPDEISWARTAGISPADYAKYK
jgi:DNA-binding NarL/FixJ family response regulator